MEQQSLLLVLTHLDETLTKIAAQFEVMNHNLGILISLDIGLALAGISLSVGGFVAIMRGLRRVR